MELGAAAGIAPGIALGAIALYPGDLLAAALAVATAMRWRNRACDRHLKRLLLAFIALLALSVVHGVLAFGLEESVAAARELLGFATAAVFFSTVSTTPRLIRSVRSWLLAASVVVLVGALGFWLERGLGTYQGSGERALNGLQALRRAPGRGGDDHLPPVPRPDPAVGATGRGPGRPRVVDPAHGLGRRRGGRRGAPRARPKGRARAEVNRTRLVALGAALAVVLLVAAGPQGTQERPHHRLPAGHR